MSIADLFRTQQAQARAPNPQDPRIGASTNLPPQLRQLMAMKAMADQAQTRQAAQAQQTPPANQMPTVAQKVQQTAMTMAEQQRQQQMAQQAMMQQAQQAQQPMQGFAHGGLATLKRRFADGGGIRYEQYGPSMSQWKKNMEGANTDPLGFVELLRSLGVNIGEQVGAAIENPGMQGLIDRHKASQLEKEQNAKRNKEGMSQRELLRQMEARGMGPGTPAPVFDVAATPEVVAPRRGPGASAAPRSAAPASAIATLLQPTGGTSGGAPSEWEAYLREQIKIKAMSPEDAMAAEEALRAKYGPKGEKLALLEKQMAEREAKIAEEKGKRPDLLTILTGMAEASAANDAKRRGGSKGAALLGAAKTIQASKKEQEAKVEALRNAQQLMAMSIAEMRDAERSGNLQAMQAAREKAVAAGQALQTAQTAIATKGFGEDRADGRTDKENTARASEGDKNRANAVRTANISAAARQASGGAGGMSGMTPYQQAQVIAAARAAAAKELADWDKSAEGLRSMSNPQAREAKKAQLLREAMAPLISQGLPLDPSLQYLNAPGASTSGTPRAGWGQAIEKP